MLIGFHLEVEREFFQLFISVEAIGPLKAVKALNIPIRDIARAIEAKDVKLLKRLNGIGERMANKIVATLYGRTGKFGMIRESDAPVESAAAGERAFVEQVIDVLVGQLGHKMAEAREMVDAALVRKPLMTDPEALFEEVYRGQLARGKENA